MRNLLLVLVLVAPGAALADEAASGPTNEDCQTCHSSAAPKKAAAADGKLVIVDDAKWKESIHGEVSVSCTDCHADLANAKLPHAAALQPAQCGSCHEKAVAAYGKGIHHVARSDGKGAAATCTSCHGDGHQILGSGDRRAPTNHLNVVATCGKCHDDPKLTAAVELPGGIVQNYADSVHGHGVKAAGLVVAPTCATCHGAHDVRRVTDPESSVARANQAATCGKCHEGIQEKYAVGIHAAQVAKGNKKAPVCAGCHTAHSIQRADRVSWELDVIAECGNCHAESMHSYRDTFHGRVTELGFTRMAKCADCHGAHDIVAKDDPKSRVAAENLVATCRTCHANANKSFVQYDPHANPSDKTRSMPLYVTALVMKALLAGVIGFFGLHTVLWLGRSLYDRSKGGR